MTEQSESIRDSSGSRSAREVRRPVVPPVPTTLPPAFELARQRGSLSMRQDSQCVPVVRDLLCVCVDGSSLEEVVSDVVNIDGNMNDPTKGRDAARSRGSRSSASQLPGARPAPRMSTAEMINATDQNEPMGSSEVVNVDESMPPAESDSESNNSLPVEEEEMLKP